MLTTDNYKKQTSRNPLQRYLIENFYKTLLFTASSIKPQSILDAGCGEGFTLNRLKKRKIGKRLEGIDFSSAAVGLGKQSFPFLNLRLGDIYQMDYKDNYFDLVICSEVLEHLKNPEKALCEIIRVSKKYCILTVPNEPLFRISNLFRGKNLSRWGNDIEHINHWSRISFPEFIKTKNLKISGVKTPFPWTIVLGEKVN